MNYAELSSLGKMAYARYTAGTITVEQVNSLTKLTSEETAFITGVE